MAILDPLILAADVNIIPAAKLSPGLRRRLGARPGDFAVTRLRGRAPARMVDRFGASLLQEFREAKPVAAAVIACADRHQLDPASLLAEAFPLLRDCFNSRFLAVAGSPEASRTLPTRDRGDVVGRYTVLRCLQVLDDTELYQARAADGSIVALKLARPGVTSSGLFTREAAVLRHLDGRGVPVLRGCGHHRGRPWLAMSWCDGIDPEIAFAELRESRDPATRRRTLRLLTRIARNYARLHASGVLHGDVHLRNLLIGRGDEPRLVDFGLARPLPPVRLGGRAGTGGVPQFFAPEQAAVLLVGADLPAPTPASEQHALAAVLYCLATGAMPWELALDRRTMLRQIVRNPPLPFVRRGTRPWPELEAVLARGLAKRPPDRYRSISEMHRALARIAVPQSATRVAGTPARDAVPGVIDAFLARVDFASDAFAATGPAPTCSLMLGRTGIAFALYRLACARDDARTLALADAWLSRIERDATTPTAFAAPEAGLDFDAVGPVSPFHSITGLHLTRALVALAMHDTRGAARAVEQFASVSETAWHKSDLTLGRGGVPLACAQLIEALPGSMPEQVTRLRGVGQRVLTDLWRELDCREPIGQAPGGEDFSAAHGWAGLLYATLRWRDATAAPLPRTLPRRLREMAGAAELLGRGVHWPQIAAGPAASIWASHQVAGWCNGPAGFVPLWTLADRHFPRSRYLALAEATAESTWEAPSLFFDLCCGLVGRAFALLNLYRYTGGPEWLERASTLARRAVRQFDRERPSLYLPHSLFKGEAGLAVLAAALHQPEAPAFPLFEPEGFPGPASHG